MNCKKIKDASYELRVAVNMVVLMAHKPGGTHVDTQAEAARFIRRHIKEAREAISKIEAALGEEQQS